MTIVEAEHEPKVRRLSFLRSRRLWFGALALAAVAAIAVAAARHYRVGPFRNDFKEALLALDQGDWSLVRRYARELKASQATLPQAHFLRGAILLDKGYYYPALEELSKAQQDAKLESAALTLTGETWYRLGRHVEAQAALLQALKQDPNSFDARRWLAASYYDLGVVDKASVELARAAVLNKTDPRPHRLLGLIYKDFGKYEDAIPFYQESLRRQADQPDATEIKEELASCQVETRRYSDALATLASCDDRSDFEVLRAKCFHAQGHLERAKAAVKRALEQDGDNLEGLLLQGTLLLEEGDARAAIEVFQRAIKTQPKDYTAHFQLAQAYGKAGEQQLSETEHELAEEIRVIRHEFSQLHKQAWERPGDARVRLRLAALAQQLNRPDLAEVWLRSAAALQPMEDANGKK